MAGFIRNLFSAMMLTGLSLLFSHPAWSQAALLPNAQQQFFDANGNPLSNGRVYMTVPNTTSPKTTWSNSTQTQNNTNPIQLDAGGWATIYGQGSYNQRVVASNGNQIWSKPTEAYGSSEPTGATGTDTAPVGSILPFSGFTIPTNWELAYGQAVNRTDYDSLKTAITISDATISCVSGSATLTGFASTAMMRVGAPIEGTCFTTGTTITSIVSASSITISNLASATATVATVVYPWGNGDGVNTFNIPDLRGRTPVGPDSMGGTISNRLTLSSTITTVSGNATASVPLSAGVYAGMAVVSANVPAGSTISTVNTAVSTTVTTTSGSPTATVASAAGLIAGMVITSANIPAATTISSISGTTLTLSGNATASAAGTAFLATVGVTNQSITLSGNATATASATAAVYQSIAGVNAPAAAGGSQSHVQTQPELAAHVHVGGAHTHGINSTALSAFSASPGSAPFALATAQNNFGTGGSFSQTAGTTVSDGQVNSANTGGSVPSTLLQPLVTINYMIKVRSNTTGAGGVVSLGGMFGDIACDATFLCAASGSPSVNYVGLATQADHTMLANISGSTAQPVAITWSQWMDSECGSTQGNLVYRGATLWGCLGPGTSGQFFKTQGAAANPLWSDLPVGTSSVQGILQGDGATLPITAGTIACRTATNSLIGCNRPDGVTIQAVGGVLTAIGAATTSIGIGTTTVAAGTDGYLLYNNAGVLGNLASSSLLDTIGSTQGSILYRNASAWVPLTPGTNGQALLSGGPAANVAWGNAVTSVTCNGGLTGGVITTTGTCAADIATNSNIWAGTANKLLDAGNVFNSAGQLVSLSGTTTVTPDFSVGFNFTFTATTATNYTLANPTNPKVGQQGCIYLLQPAAGTVVTITYGANWKTAGGVTGKTLTATLGAVDRLCYLVRTTSFIDFSLAGDIKS